MNYNRTVKNDGTKGIFALCAVVFCTFSFLWLYYFQADLLSVAQHVYSGGRTHYNRIIGALLITVVLQLLQLGVYSIVKLQKRTHALTYFPSMLMLAILSSFSPGITLGYVLLASGVSTLLWGGAVLSARKMQTYEASIGNGLFSRSMWGNMLLLAIMIMGVGAAANTNAVFHYRAHAETALLDGDDDEALRVGSRSLETDGNLMMLRMYALSRKGLLGERLFHYPIIATSEAMLPTSGRVATLKLPVDSIFRHIGAVPRHPMPAMDFLQLALKREKPARAAADYRLCGHLIDKNLDAFAREITQYYEVNDSLPRHYREALVLYTHRRSHPVITYHDDVLDVDYEDLQKLEAQYSLPTARKGKVLEAYEGSYWYYYEYQDPVK